MTTEFRTRLEALDQFAIFRGVIEQNIGYFPTIHYDPTGSAHRVRQFTNPPAAEVRYSIRALARYIEIGDIGTEAKTRKSDRVLMAGMCLLMGGELLRNDRFFGLAFVARAIQEIGFNKMSDATILQTALDNAAKGDNVLALINLFLPLAHEIGHLTEAQLLGPAAIHGDGIFETYRINYRAVLSFTGEFDYSASLADPASPLCLAVLREEAASDFFATAAVATTLHRSLKPGDTYPLDLLASGVFMFPLVMTVQALCFKNLSKPELQQATLAMHCRYSLLKDSVRAFAKGMFNKRQDFAEIESTIDRIIDGVIAEFDEYFELVWDAFMAFAKEFMILKQLDEPQVFARLRETSRDVNRRLAIARYLETISQEVQAYPINADNLGNLRKYVDVLRTFDTITIGEDGKVILR
jgi:hypothetical protein